jgi:hypothetical protein
MRDDRGATAEFPLRILFLTHGAVIVFELKSALVRVRAATEELGLKFWENAELEQ